jgi:type IV secretion system protein VirB11
VTSAAVYLRSYLAPFAPLLERPEVTDVFVNRPGEVWVETLQGGLECHEAAELDETLLWRLARQIASFSHQGISREHPLLSATLPGGERVQIIAPPATRAGLAMAVRKHAVADLDLGDYEAMGAFSHVAVGRLSEAEALETRLAQLLAEGKIAEFLRLAVRARKNIVVSGGTSTGKTTFLNALIKEIPAAERLILIEDTPEIRLERRNSIGLVAVRGEQGEAQVTADHLVQGALRMRPDRIIMGELRGGEAASFLRAVNTGHPGSITTVHADSPRSAAEQLALLVLQTGINLGRMEIIGYIDGIVDVFVQLSRAKGRRTVSQIDFRRRSGAPVAVG